jgi:hypothetical protein
VLIKVLETERLILGRLTIDGAEFIDEVMNEPAFIENVADRGIRTTADAVAYVATKILPSYERFGFGFYLRRFCGNSYAFEAAEAVMAYGNNVLGLPRVVGVTAPGSQTSIL